MKIATIAATLFLSLAASTYAQTLTVNSVALSLGEPEVKARADIKAAGMEIQTKWPDFLVISAKRGETDELFGEISFAKGKVTWIQRDWYVNQTPNDKNALANIFYSAAASLLEGDEHANCMISVKTQDKSPRSGISNTTKIECVRPGHDHVLLMSGVDCSAGCSIGNISSAFVESIKQINEQK